MINDDSDNSTEIRDGMEIYDCTVVLRDFLTSNKKDKKVNGINKLSRSKPQNGKRFVRKPKPEVMASEDSDSETQLDEFIADKQELNCFGIVKSRQPLKSSTNKPNLSPVKSHRPNESSPSSSPPAKKPKDSVILRSRTSSSSSVDQNMTEEEIDLCNTQPNIQLKQTAQTNSILGKMIEADKIQEENDRSSDAGEFYSLSEASDSEVNSKTRQKKKPKELTVCEMIDLVHLTDHPLHKWAHLFNHENFKVLSQKEISSLSKVFMKLIVNPEELTVNGKDCSENISS